MTPELFSVPPSVVTIVAVGFDAKFVSSEGAALLRTATKL